jgi:hypothetical protein
MGFSSFDSVRAFIESKLIPLVLLQNQPPEMVVLLTAILENHATPTPAVGDFFDLQAVHCSVLRIVRADPGEDADEVVVVMATYRTG